MMINGEMGTLRPILETMPRHCVEASPELALAFGGALLARGDHAGRAALPAPRRGGRGAGARRTAARRSPPAGPRWPCTRAACAATPMAALRAARELLERRRRPRQRRAEQRRALLRPRPARHRRAVDRRPRRRDRASRAGPRQRRRRRATDWTALAAAAHLAVARAFRGEIARALRHADDAVRLAERRGWGRSEPAGAAYCVQAAVAIQRGRHEEARRLVARASEALHETRDRPLRAVHALNRALLLSDAGEPEAALSVLQVARDEVGDWPLLAPLEDQLLAQEALLRAAVGERERGARCSSAPSARPRRRSRSPTPWPGCACWRASPGAARDAARPAPRATATGRGRRRAGVGPRRGVAARRAGARRARRAPTTPRRSLERSLDLAEPAGLRRLIVEHGNRVRPLLHRHVRHGTAHPAIVGEALDDDRAPRQASGHARSPCSWPSR